MQKRTLDLVQELLAALTQSKLPMAHRIAALKAATAINEGLDSVYIAGEREEILDPSFDSTKERTPLPA